MTDVFISYARTDLDVACQLELALRNEGYEVWRDSELPPHRPYADVIEERLSSAKAVVVIWSKDAAKSQWVRAEADAARSAGKLVQASLDGAIPPIPFNQIHCADLKQWEGSADSPGFRNLAVGVSALAGAGVSKNAPATGKNGRLSICVLPFANMSGDPEQEYFSDGISEDIITDLTKVSSLSVTARNTAFIFKGKAVDVRNVAKQLGVSHVLEGSVRKVGGRVRITAQLIDGVAGDQLWAERYDRDLTDIFAIQDELSAAIVDTLKVKLQSKEKQAIESRPANAEAYDLYLMARQYWINGNYGDSRCYQTIVRICRRALEIDPCYARAWTLLSLAYTDLWMRFQEMGADDNSLAAAEEALSLDPSLAEAHSVKAICLFGQGDEIAGEREMAQALQLDPNSWEVNKQAGALELRRGRPADAIPYLAKATELAEADFHSPGLLLICQIAVGNKEAAEAAARIDLDRVKRALAQNQDNGVALGHGAYCLAYLGEIDQAKQWTNRALLIDPDNLTLRYNIACSFVVNLNDLEAALDLLGPFFEQASAGLVTYAETDPDMIAIRGDPRFIEMLNRAKMRHDTLT